MVSMDFCGCIGYGDVVQSWQLLHGSTICILVRELRIWLRTMDTIAGALILKWYYIIITEKNKESL